MRRRLKARIIYRNKYDFGDERENPRTLLMAHNVLSTFNEELNKINDEMFAY